MFCTNHIFKQWVPGRNTPPREHKDGGTGAKYHHHRRDYDYLPANDHDVRESDEHVGRIGSHPLFNNSATMLTRPLAQAA